MIFIRKFRYFWVIKFNVLRIIVDDYRLERFEDYNNGLQIIVININALMSFDLINRVKLLRTY